MIPPSFIVVVDANVLFPLLRSRFEHGRHQERSRDIGLFATVASAFTDLVRAGCYVRMRRVPINAAHAVVLAGMTSSSVLWRAGRRVRTATVMVAAMKSACMMVRGTSSSHQGSG